MPRRRRLQAGISNAASALSDVLGSMLQGRMIDARQSKAQQAVDQRTMLTQTLADIDKLGDPKTVRDMGVPAAQAQFNLFKRRLPAAQQGLVQEPDFQSLDRPYPEKLGLLAKELEGATSADDPRLTAQGLRKKASLFGVSPDVQVPNLLPGSAGLPSGAQVEDPAFADITKMAEQMRAGLLAKEPGQMVPDFGSGTRTDRFIRNRDLSKAGPMQAERTPEQEAGRQGDIRTATAQAEQDVVNDPRNVKGYLDRAEAEAYRTRLAGLTADRKMGAGSYAPQWEVVEDQDASGNKLYRVINKQAGGTISTGVSSETVTDAMRTAYSYAQRGITAHNTMLQLEPLMQQRGYLETRAGLTLDEINAPELISDPVIRKYAQATRVFINAALGRPESGGAIQEDEYKRYAKIAAFQPGGSAELPQVQSGRRETIQGLQIRAGQRLGGQITTAEELTAADKAQGGNTPVDQLIQQAEQDGYKVMR